MNEYAGAPRRVVRVLFISYYIDDPTVPGFSPKYHMLSKRWEGDVLHLAPDYFEHSAGRFVFRGCRYNRKNVLIRQLQYLLFCLRHVFKQGPYDLVVSYDPMICGIISLVVKPIAKAKLLVEVNTDHFFRLSKDRESLPERVTRWIKTGMMRLSFWGADAVKFINSRLATDYTKRFKLERKPGLVRATFFSFIGTQAFSPANPSEDRVILSVGHPFEVKGVDTLIRAFNRIAPLYPGVTLKVIGMCHNLSDYQALVGDRTRVVFLPGVSHKEIVSHFQQCLFYVLASRTESMGRVMVEAMACGKAVVGARVGGVPDVVVDGETGLLFQADDDVDLADKMARLLDDPDLRRGMGEAGLRRCDREFSPERYSELYFGFVDRILALRGRDA